MPAPRVINTTPDKPDPTGVEEFFSKLGTHYKDKQDRVQIGDLYKQYKQNEDDANSIEDFFMSVENSTVSPSKKISALKAMKEGRELVNERRKILNAHAKQLQDESKKTTAQNNNIESLRRAGATEEQIDLYNASPVGGQTKVVESIVEEQSRKKTPSGLVSSEIEDYDKGLTPKERVKRQDARYSVQTPLVMKNSESLHGLETENLSIGLLQELDETGKVGEGLQKLNINPKTGDLFLPQAATPEEQLFVKTVNDFTVKAKDSFGARVTNFELDRFMQRLPTLANSKEGRGLIMRQMQIVNQINQLEKKEIQKVFDQYGVRNIDYADAENKAREAIKDQKEDLRKEYFNLEQLAKKEDAETVKKIKDKVPEGYTPMRKPDGTIKMFPTKNVPNLEEKGYKQI